MADSDGKLRLPWTGEFSPGQLGERALAETITIVGANKGDRAAIVSAFRERWFSNAATKRKDPSDRLRQQNVRSGNVLNGMQSYGLVSDSYYLTDLGEELLAETNAEKRSELFAAFLLKHRQGLELLDAVRGLHQRHTSVTKKNVVDELRKRGYWFTTNSGDAGKLRQWLGTAGIVDVDWRINDERIAAIAGTSLTTIGEWQSLTRVQRAFLQTVRRLGETRGTSAIPSPELLEFVRDEHGAIFDESQVKKIYQALGQGGWISHAVKSAGRGGKGGLIAATPKLLDVDFELLLGFKPGDLPADLRAVMTTPREKIYKDLDSRSAHIKGIALELLAVNVASDLGLTPLSLRVRGVRTGGAEVDLVSEGAHLLFSRWLFQCKNTKTVNVDVLAKEVGMATLLQANVIVIVTTGKFSKTVGDFAEHVSETTPFQVVLADQSVLEAHRDGGASALRERFHRSAENAMRLKRPQVLDTLDELGEDGASS
ncbi:MAG: restriction endonuclease [Actinomycetota bacterium]